MISLAGAFGPSLFIIQWNFSRKRKVIDDEKYYRSTSTTFALPSAYVNLLFILIGKLILLICLLLQKNKCVL